MCYHFHAWKVGLRSGGGVGSHIMRPNKFIEKRREGPTTTNEMVKKSKETLISSSKFEVL